MSELLTAAQMRAIEVTAIASGLVTGLELMERAGAGVVGAIFKEWPELEKTSHRAVVLCGPGNNGGDGFVVARLLRAWGWAVEVFLYGDAEKLPPDARVNYERWAAMAEVRSLSDAQVLPYDGWKCDVVIDALFGTGLSRPMSGLRELTSELVEVFDNYHGKPDYPKILSVDVPSETCSDSARFLHTEKILYPYECISADLTVTFHRAKIAHYLQADLTYCGKVKIVGIGLPQTASKDAVQLLQAPYLGQLKKSFGHKYGHGHALILSGGASKTGAARLAARGALRIGAGLVSVASPPSALMENASHLTAIMVRRLENAGALTDMLADKRLNAICLGPGLGVSEKTRDMVSAALSAKRPTVLDADALMSFEEDPEALFSQLHEGCVLTPHEGEFARLFPSIYGKMKEPAVTGPAYSKVDATRAAAALAGCVVLFKGADTVIADPSGRVSINSAHYERSAPWLATAGSGDVLAGFITGLLARRFEPMLAAETAAWLHVGCALEFGPGLIAEDLSEQLPAVFRNLGV